MTKTNGGIDARANEILKILDELPDSPATQAAAALVQARDAGSGGLREEYLQEAQRLIATIDPRQNPKLVQRLQAQVLALQGRGGDTEMAHVTPGEIVIPKRMRTPELMAALHAAARNAGIDPARLVVGDRQNAINPHTGQPEFYEAETDMMKRLGLNYGVELPEFRPSYPPGQFIGPNPPPVLKAPPLTRTGRFLMGAADPIHASAQDLVHALPNNAVEAVNRTLGPDLAPTAGQLDQQMQLREQEYAARRADAGQSGIDYWRRAGNIVGAAPAALLNPPRAFGVLGGPATGAVQEMLTEPVTDGQNFATEKIKQGAEGAAKEGILDALRRKRFPGM